MSRQLKFLAAFGGVIGASAITWLLSWLMQYTCSITLANVSFDFTGRPANRLAVGTIIAVALIVMLWHVIWSLYDGCVMLFVVMWFLSGIGTVAFWASTHAFPGTSIATHPAQIVYGVLVVLWSLILWYVFIESVARPSEDG